MTDNLKNFLEAISNNDELKEKVNRATKDEIISIAKEMQIELKEEDLDIQSAQEFSDDELAAVTGGGQCICVAGGCGDDNGLTGGCILLGMGWCLPDSHCTGHGNGACFCLFAGGGFTDGRECDAGTNSNF